MKIQTKTHGKAKIRDDDKSNRRARFNQKVVIPKQLLDLPYFRHGSRGKRDNIALFCHAILMFGGKDVMQGVQRQVSTKNLRKLVGERNLKEIRKQLNDANLVLCDGAFSYRNKEWTKSLAYQFGSLICADDFVHYALQSESGSNRWEKFLHGSHQPESQVRKDLKPIHVQLLNKLDGFQIDTQKAIQIQHSLPLVKQPSAFYAIKRIRDQGWDLSVSETGRAYTPLTNLNKELRAALYWKRDPHQKLCVIDASCFQPLLLCLLLRGKIAEDSLRRYQSLCECGQLYDQIASDIGLNRSDVKVAMISYLCGPWLDPAKANNREGERSSKKLVREVADWFTQFHPSVDAYLKAEKTDPQHAKRFNTCQRRQSGKSTGAYAIIAHRLQRLESEAVIEACFPQIIEQCPDSPLATIHDAFVVSENCGEEVAEIMTKEFERRGVRLTVTRE